MLNLFGQLGLFPFDVTSDAKRVLALTGNTTNIWNYKCEVTFYDGTKKDFTFKINIDNGKIVTDEVKLQAYLSMSSLLV